MRRIIIWAMSTLTVLVLLFSYSTSRNSTTLATAETRSVVSSTKESTGATSGSSGDTTSQEPTGGASASTNSSTGSSSGSGSSGTSTSATTYSGDAFGTRYGDVQVQITVENGKITAVNVLQVPWQDRHDQMINSQAVPIYNSEAVQTQSASIDVVSGATVTWEGYTQSLQSAIDKANL